MAKQQAQTDEAQFGSDAEVFDARTKNAYLELVQDPTIMNPADVSRDIVQRILDTDSVDDILDMGDSATLDARDIAERPFRIMSVPNWYKSSFRDGPGVFVALDILLLDTTERQVVTVGGSNVIAQIYKLQTKAVFADLENIPPMRFVSKGTSSGFDVLWLARAKQTEAAK